MYIPNSKLQALRTGFQTLFNQGLGKAIPVSDIFTTPTPSTSKKETYGFLGGMPIFREWIGAKRAKTLEEKEYDLTNRNFEATITVHKHRIADDNLGLLSTDMMGIGEDAAGLKNRLAFEALKLGDSKTCYDDQYFFDTDHVINEVIFSNNDTTGAVQPMYFMDLRKPRKPILYQNREAPHFVSNVSADGNNDHLFETGEYKFGGETRGAAGYTYWQLAYRNTTALSPARWQAIKAIAASLTDDNGQPIGIRYTHCVAGASTVDAAQALFEKQYLAGGETNQFFGKCTVIDASDWLP